MRARLNALLGWLSLLCAALRAAFGLRDVFMFGGLACAARGAYLVSEPLAWLLVGGVLMLLALRLRSAE